MKTPKTIYLKDYTPPAYIVDHIDLTFDIEDDQTKVISRLHVLKSRDVADPNTTLAFDKGDCEILSVIAGGMVLLPGEYGTDSDTFTLAKTPASFELEITTRLKPSENTSLEGLYVSGGVLVTQCESQGFRKIT